MSAARRLRLRQSVGIVIGPGSVEFFKSNTRTSLTMRLQTAGALEFLKNFDGRETLAQIGARYSRLPFHQVEAFASTLLHHHVLIEHDEDYSQSLVEEHYRLVNLLEDYFHSTSAVTAAIGRIRRSKVAIIGLGAVGSQIAIHLVRLGIGALVLMDPDTVDLSNLHRQSYFEQDIGCHKATQLKERLKEVNPGVEVTTALGMLDEGSLQDSAFEDVDLIVNCADYPSVDHTSRLVAAFAMRKSTPHIVGGGYNLHLTLIGQTIIPGKTACFMCFHTFLQRLNEAELQDVRRLHREDRKLGSFAPLSGIAASLAALDAWKVLCGAESFIQNANRRIEFDSRAYRFNVIDIPQSPECSWCGTNIAGSPVPI